MIESYSSIYNLGHAAISELFKGPVLIEEKVDGSQFSFTKRADTGEVECRSKGAQINMLAPEGMFQAGVDYVKSIADALVPGFIYRGEYLKSKKHNVLCYDRAPQNHIILFEVVYDDGSYASPAHKQTIAKVLGFECVPLFFNGIVTDVTLLRSFLDRESILGGQKIEGVVVKPANYDLFGRDKKLLIGKFVSEAFKEVHASDWKKEHGTPGSKEIISVLTGMYGTPARWAKALIHLREKNSVLGEMRDIPHLLKEVQEDVERECGEEIKTALYNWAMPQLKRAIVRGLPEWYKDELAKAQFATPEVASTEAAA